MSRHRTLLSLMALLAVPIESSRVHAQEGAVVELVELHFSDDHGCINPTLLTRAVETRLGRPVFSANGGRIVHARIDKRGQNVRVTFRVTDAPGIRVVNGDDCEELAEASALVLTILIDPEYLIRSETAPGPATTTADPTLTEPNAEPPSDPQPTSPPPPAETCEDCAPAAAPDAGGIVVEGGLAALAAVGLLPQVAFGIAGQLSLWLRDYLSVQISLHALPQSVATDPSGGRGTFRSFGGSLAGCLDASATPMVRLGGCIGVAGAALVVIGSGFSGDNDRATRAEFWPELTVRTALVLRPVVLQLWIAAGVPAVRDEFYVELPAPGQRPLHQASPVVGRGGLALLFR